MGIEIIQDTPRADANVKRERKVDLTKRRTVDYKGIYEETLHKIDVYRKILFPRWNAVGAPKQSAGYILWRSRVCFPRINGVLNSILAIMERRSGTARLGGTLANVYLTSRIVRFITSIGASI